MQGTWKTSNENHRGVKLRMGTIGEPTSPVNDTDGLGLHRLVMGWWGWLQGMASGLLIMEIKCSQYTLICRVTSPIIVKALERRRLVTPSIWEVSYTKAVILGFSTRRWRWISPISLNNSLDFQRKVHPGKPFKAQISQAASDFECINYWVPILSTLSFHWCQLGLWVLKPFWQPGARCLSLGSRTETLKISERFGKFWP